MCINECVCDGFVDNVHVSGGEAYELILEFHHKNGLVLIDLVTFIPLMANGKFYRKRLG